MPLYNTLIPVQELLLNFVTLHPDLNDFQFRRPGDQTLTRLTTVDLQYPMLSASFLTTVDHTTNQYSKLSRVDLELYFYDLQDQNSDHNATLLKIDNLISMCDEFVTYITELDDNYPSFYLGVRPDYVNLVSAVSRVNTHTQADDLVQVRLDIQLEISRRISMCDSRIQ